MFVGMTVTLTIPDEVSADLASKFSNPGQAALEALAARAYECGALSLAQIRTMLNLGSRWEAEEVLARHGVWPGTTSDDLSADITTLGGFLAVGK